MLSTTRTFTLDGISAQPVRVEVDVHRGLPGFAIVGLPDAGVREARERVRAALVNCGFEFPLQRIVVNLAPASLRKVGPGMDLAVAAALLGASGQVDCEGLTALAFVGELGLDGAVRKIDGALPIAEAAREGGVQAIVVPAENGPEAALAGGVEVRPLTVLSELPSVIAGSRLSGSPEPFAFPPSPPRGAPDLADLRGQPHLRHALEVGAAGGHSLLMVGPPGAGKSLAATRLPSILPPLGYVEALEVARIASVTGRFGARLHGGLPFRAPHHTISAAGLIGGGIPPRPGEITLAHGGVLFLDELGEFRRDAVEALRAPLESGEVAIGRAGRIQRLPCRFTLVAASDPCPCGRGENEPDCNCSPAAIDRYRNRLNGALTDQIELRIQVQPPSLAEIGQGPGESSAEVRERVCAARRRQERRLGPGRSNGEMMFIEARECRMEDSAADLLNTVGGGQGAGAHIYLRALRVAQTVTDLADEGSIAMSHVADAVELCGIAAPDASDRPSSDGTSSHGPDLGGTTRGVDHK